MIISSPTRCVDGEDFVHFISQSEKRPSARSNISLLFYVLYILMPSIDGIRILVFENVTFIGLSSENSTMIFNKTCQECLCQLASNTSVLNCFSNKTCQAFSTAPRRYRVAPANGTQLLFPNGIPPNKSQCCMSNLTEVLNRLQTGNRTTVNITSPRCLIISDNGLLVTPDRTPRFLRGYDPVNLTLTMQLQINISSPFVLGQHAGAYYLGLQNSSILVINITNLQILNIISSSALSGVRDMIFLDGGQTMVVASVGSNRLAFFKQVTGSSHNYTFSYHQLVNYVNSHGLLYINDTLFYGTSWMNNTMYAYEKVNETLWTERLMIDPRPWTNTSGGHHVMLDECDRFWYALGDAGVLVFDENGVYLGKAPLPSLTSAFDAIITENYVLYVSDIGSKRLIRIDPNIQC